MKVGRLLFSLLIIVEMTVAIASDIKLSPRSGYEFQSIDTQSMQADDFENPGMLWVDMGELYYNEPAGKMDQSCADCHGEFPKSLATSFPKNNHHLEAVVNLTSQIQHCRTVHQKAEPIDYESETSLALTVYLASRARGEMVNQIDSSPVDQLKASIENGRVYFHQRKGQLNLSCSNCHDSSVGKMLRGDLISQGQSNGYPIYRLEWQSLGSLHRRFRSCDIGVKAQAQALGSSIYINLEAYLKERGGDLLIETPAVRR
ncbi:MAG: sulfur oxidation c-type cytochrome SoxA [Oceanicoccus sp.]